MYVRNGAMKRALIIFIVIAMLVVFSAFSLPAECKAAEAADASTDPAVYGADSPDTADTTLIIIAFAAVLSVAAAICAFITYHSNNRSHKN